MAKICLEDFRSQALVNQLGPRHIWPSVLLGTIAVVAKVAWRSQFSRAGERIGPSLQPVMHHQKSSCRPGVGGLSLNESYLQDSRSL
eukprot:3984880-Karenia_brevis.AAC.1